MTKNEADGNIVTGKLKLSDSANKYFPSVPISYFRASLFVFAVFHAVFKLFAVERPGNWRFQFVY